MTPEQEREWRKEVQAGERVFIKRVGMASVSLTSTTIKRVTATQIIIENGDAYMRSTGLLRGASTFHPPSIHPHTAELAEQYAQQKKDAKVRNTIRGLHRNLGSLSREQMDDLHRRFAGLDVEPV